MKYPAIYKSVEGSEYLYQNKDSYYCYERQLWDSSEPHHDCHHSDKNITAEYLANTYGEVKSKEHAEFIVKLSGGGSSTIGNLWSQTLKCFVIDSDGKVSFGSRVYYQEKVGKREITIPLPPECESVDEWPKVGDEVETNFGKGVVELPPDVKGCFVVQVNGGYLQLKRDELGKPKTPEQELRDELISYFREIGQSGIVLIGRYDEVADDFMSKYNITKKGESDE